MMIISERKRFLVDYFPKRVDKNKDVNVVIFSTQNFFSLEMMFQKKKTFFSQTGSDDNNIMILQNEMSNECIYLMSS